MLKTTSTFHPRIIITIDYSIFFWWVISYQHVQSFGMPLSFAHVYFDVGLRNLFYQLPRSVLGFCRIRLLWYGSNLKSLDSHILYPFLDFLVSNIHCRNTSVPAFRLASKWLMVKNGETFINHGEVWTDVPWYITPQMLPSTMLCHDVMTPPVCVSAFQNCDRIHFTFFFFVEEFSGHLK